MEFAAAIAAYKCEREFEAQAKEIPAVGKSRAKANFAIPNATVTISVTKWDLNKGRKC
jgi:hypothetical protein